MLPERVTWRVPWHSGPPCLLSRGALRTMAHPSASSASDSPSIRSSERLAGGVTLQNRSESFTTRKSHVPSCIPAMVANPVLNPIVLLEEVLQQLKTLQLATCVALLKDYGFSHSHWCQTHLNVRDCVAGFPISIQHGNHTADRML